MVGKSKGINLNKKLVKQRRENMEKKSSIEKLNAFTSKISSNIYIQALSQGMMQGLPLVILGAFASLLSGLPIESYQAFINQTGIAACLQVVVSFSTNFLGVIYAYLIASSLAELLNVKARIIGILAVFNYLILMPLATIDKVTYVPFDYTGAQGIFVAMIVSMLTVKIFKFITDKNLIIKMPNGTPSYVSGSFSGLIPVFITAVLFLIIRYCFGLTPFGSFFAFIYKVLQTPLTAIVGSNIISVVVFNIITQVLWVFGIHGGAVVSGLRGPVLMGLDIAQQGAYAAGQPLPNIFGLAFEYMYIISVAYPAMAIALLLFAKSKRYKTLGKVALPASFFGISEPLVFGLPVLFNPIMAIPFIFVPVIGVVIAYFVTAIGLVARPMGLMVFNVPLGINGIMNGSWTIAACQIVLLIISIVLWYPFIKIADKKIFEEEQKGDAVENK